MKLLIMIFWISLFSATVYAQGTILDIDPSKPFHHGSFTFSHPYLDQWDDYISSFSGSYNLNMNLLLSDSFILHFGIPYNYTKIKNDYLEQSESGTGNIRFGLQKIAVAEKGSYAAVQFFLYLPTSDENAFSIGLFSDNTDWAPHYPDIYSIIIQYAAHFNNPGRYSLNYFIGGNLLIPNDDDFLEDPELFFRFAIEPAIHISLVDVFATFKTVAIITSNADNFGDRFRSFFGIGTALNLDNFYPKLSYRFYLDDDIKDFIDGVLILGLDFNIGE